MNIYVQITEGVDYFAVVVVKGIEGWRANQTERTLLSFVIPRGQLPLRPSHADILAHVGQKLSQRWPAPRVDPELPYPPADEGPPF